MTEYGDSFIPTPSASTSVPKLQYYPELENDARVERKPVNRSRFGEAEKVALIRICAIIIGFVILFGMCASIIMVDKKIISNKQTISELNGEIAQANAENTRLKASLEALVSVEKIQDYAVSVLGMQKAERYQIHYFDDRDGDKVVLADGRALNADTQG